MFSSFIRTITVGKRFSLFQHFAMLADFVIHNITAGGESHPALKIFSLYLYYMFKKIKVNRK